MPKVKKKFNEKLNWEIKQFLRQEPSSKKMTKPKITRAKNNKSQKTKKTQKKKNKKLKKEKQKKKNKESKKGHHDDDQIEVGISYCYKAELLSTCTGGVTFFGMSNRRSKQTSRVS